MAGKRGPRKTAESQIAVIDAKIAKKEGEIKALKDQRAELAKAHQTELAARIAKLVDEKGLTLEDVLASLETK